MKRIIPCLLLFLLIGEAVQAELRLKADLQGFRADAPYSYLRLTVENPNLQGTEYEVVIKDTIHDGEIILNDLEIEAGGRRIHNIPVSLGFPSYVEVNDGFGDLSRSTVAVNHRFLLNIADLENWASESDSRNFSKACTASHTPMGPSSGVQDALLQMEPDVLPDNWLCYSPFLIILVHEPVYNRMAPAQRKALLKWVGAGGDLVIYGTDRPGRQSNLLGHVVYHAGDPFKFPYLDQRVDYRQKFQWEQYYQGGRITDFPYDIKGRIGKIGGFILATLFVILAGPVNYLYFRKKKNVRMILVSLPVISIAFCLVIIFYFFVTQGFSKKGGSFSVTRLDETEDEAMTFSIHSLYSGMYPFGGFSFDRETAFYPMSLSGDYQIVLSGKQNLKSGIFSPGSNFHYFTMNPHSTRERLLYDPQKSTISNGFEEYIHGVVFKAGERIYQAKDIEPGGEAPLSEIQDPESFTEEFDNRFLNAEETNFFRKRMFSYATTNLPTRGNEIVYLVKFRGNVDTEGIESGTRIGGDRNSNILIGVKGSGEEND